VPDNDVDLTNVVAEYDTIIAFSVTKWIHLNFGDQGLKRFFKRIYRTLLPGGRLLLEPQPWSSYRLKRRMTVRSFFLDRKIHSMILNIFRKILRKHIIT